MAGFNTTSTDLKMSIIGDNYIWQGFILIEVCHSSIQSTPRCVNLNKTALGSEIKTLRHA